jgi:hypothetical protein
MSDNEELEKQTPAEKLSSDELETQAPAEKLAPLEKAEGVDAYEAKKKEEELQEKLEEIILDSVDPIGEAVVKISPELQQRRRNVLRFFFTSLFALLGSLIYIFTQITNTSTPHIPVSILFFIGSFVLFHIFNLYYRSKAKNDFLTHLAEYTGLSWNKKGIFPVNDLMEHCVLPLHDKNSCVDGFEGIYKEIPLSFQEILLIDVEPHPTEKNQTREYVSFWGIAVRIKLRKPLQSHTVVMPDNALQTFFRTKFSQFQRINIVSNKFEAKYDVMGTDQVEGRYVLDPAFIERFIETGDMLQSKWIEASFKGEEVVFVIKRNKPFINIGQLWTNPTEAFLERSTSEICAVLNIIDVLKLNPKVGL